MADIASKQNLPANLQRLAAQRRLYSVAKRVAAAQAVLAGATPLLAALAVVLRPASEVWAALVGIVVSVLDVAVLDPWQKKLRELAGSIQEEFDCAVLGLPWNTVLGGAKPSPEDIHGASSNDTVRDDAPLENWYPAAVDVLPLYQARWIVQRTNCWWDSKLRQRYSLAILISLGFLTAAVVVLGLINGMTLAKFVLAVVAPLSPAVLWAAREVQRQNNAARELDRLKEFGRSVWEQLVANTLSEAEAERTSRQFQDAILSRRKDNPFVFDWIYRRERKAYEASMKAGARSMVDEING